MTVVRGIHASAVRQRIALKEAAVLEAKSLNYALSRSEISAPTDTRETSRSQRLWSPDAGM